GIRGGRNREVINLQLLLKAQFLLEMTQLLTGETGHLIEQVPPDQIPEHGVKRRATSLALSVSTIALSYHKFPCAPVDLAMRSRSQQKELNFCNSIHGKPITGPNIEVWQYTLIELIPKPAGPHLRG